MDAGTIINRICVFSKALSEDVRVRILMCLQGGELSLQHFVDIFGLAPSTVFKHLHVLEDAGLVVSKRTEGWRLYQWPERAGHSLPSSSNRATFIRISSSSVISMTGIDFSLLCPKLSVNIILHV